jgi:putative serine protease PepD
MTIWNSEPPPTPPTGSQPGGWGAPPTPPPPPPPAPPSPPNRTGGGWRAVLAVVAVASLLGAGFLLRGAVDGARPPAETAIVSDGTLTSLPAGPTATLDAEGTEPIADVAAALAPAVVQISVQSDRGSGLGSGVLYDDRGLVMTNAHVVADAQQVQVRLSDGRSLEGSVIGRDAATDIAVVEITGEDEFPVAPLAVDDPVVGQTAVALGSPFGLDQTVTAGIVSAVDRPVPNDQGIAVNMLQTDAPINPGNSGGALANRRGELIGINTAIFSQSGENNGIGFAIPIRIAKDVADKILAGDPLDKGALGIQGTGTASGDPGAVVESVVADGPAEQAGVQVGDRVVAVDGNAVRSFNELQGRIGTYSPGDIVTIDVVRDGRSLSFEVTLGTRS